MRDVLLGRPDMCGIDWDAVLAQYRPLVERVASPDEFADLLREVLGELGTSHAYVHARPGATRGRRTTSGPSACWAPTSIRTADGGWAARAHPAGRVLGLRGRVHRWPAPVSARARVLTHVDGAPASTRSPGPRPLLAGAGGTTVELTSPRRRRRDAARRVAVAPLIDERPLRYQDWVAERRDVVRELSGGRCGYLHIPDMGGSGWAQFNRDLRMEVARPALIVDVRGNAGGHISELVIERLSRSVLGWDLTRDAQPVSYTNNAPRGPVVALADEATASDGDMITAAFKLLGPRPGGRHPHLGRGGRHDGPPPAGRRHGDHRADERGVVRRVRLVGSRTRAWTRTSRSCAPPWTGPRAAHSVPGVAVRTALDLLERAPRRGPARHQRSPGPLPPTTATPARRAPRTPVTPSAAPFTTECEVRPGMPGWRSP